MRAALTRCARRASRRERHVFPKASSHRHSINVLTGYFTHRPIMVDVRAALIQVHNPRAAETSCAPFASKRLACSDCTELVHSACVCSRLFAATRHRSVVLFATGPPLSSGQFEQRPTSAHAPWRHGRWLERCANGVHDTFACRRDELPHRWNTTRVRCSDVSGPACICVSAGDISHIRTTRVLLDR